MNDKELIDSLANTLALTRAEIDGMRVVLMAATATLAQHPSTMPLFVSTLQANIDQDEAFAIASVMTNGFLAQRTQWLRKLLPGHVHTMLRLP